MQGPSGDLEQFFTAFYEDFFGTQVRIILPPGDEARMCVSDAINAVGAEFFPPKQLAGFYVRFGKEFFVRSNGSVERLRMATREDIFKLLMHCHSPKLAAFRDWASKVLTDVIRKGYHVDPHFNGSAPLPPDLANDPIIAIRVQQIEMEKAILAVDAKAEAAKSEAAKAVRNTALVLDQVKGRHGWYALAPWADKPAARVGPSRLVQVPRLRLPPPVAEALHGADAVGPIGDGPMLTATHPYGTTRRCRVEDVILSRRLSTVIAIDELDEGHLLFYRRDQVEARKGDVGTLTFTAGGPTGGYWLFTRDDPPPISTEEAHP